MLRRLRRKPKLVKEKTEFGIWFKLGDLAHYILVIGNPKEKIDVTNTTEIIKRIRSYAYDTQTKEKIQLTTIPEILTQIAESINKLL